MYQLKDQQSSVPPLVKGKPTEHPVDPRPPLPSPPAVQPSKTQPQTASKKEAPNKSPKPDPKPKQQPKGNKGEQESETQERSHSRSRSRSRGKGKKQNREDRRENGGRQRERDRDNRSDRDRNRRKDYGRNEDPAKSSTYFKTKMCPAYMNGKCHKEGKCTFAHGQQQLRDMPNFKKTKLCIEYSHGKCPYSSRECKYAHGEAELKRHMESKQDYEAEMNKYRINTAIDSSYSYGGSFGSSAGYSHPPPPVAGPSLYPPSGYGAHLMADWKVPQATHPAPYDNRSPNPGWPAYTGAWQRDVGSSSVSASGYPGFDGMSSMSSGPGPIPNTFRGWDYGATAGRNDLPLASSPATFSGSSAPSSFGASREFGGSGPSHFASSNPYSSTSGSQFPTAGSSGPYAPTGSSGSYASSYHAGSTAPSINFDPFSIGMGQTMPRRVPPPPPER